MRQLALKKEEKPAIWLEYFRKKLSVHDLFFLCVQITCTFKNNDSKKEIPKIRQDHFLRFTKPLKTEFQTCQK